MKYNIAIVTALLQADAKRYREEYDKLVQEKEKNLENAKSGYIGEKLKQKNERIEADFQTKVVELKTECTRCLEDVEALREQERTQLKKYNKTTVEKVLALKNVPLTEDEFSVLMDDESISNDYMAKKILMSIAEGCGIDVIKTGIGADYTTKMDVLNQLEKQFTNLLTNYPDAGGDKDEELRCKHVYLSDQIVNTAIEIYGGKVDLKTEEEKVMQAYFTVKAKAGDIERGFAIGNTLRNAEDNNVRNRFIYNIVMDKDISDASLQLSGAYNEIDDFRRNGLKKYEQAIKGMDKVRGASNEEAVQLVVSENRDNKYFSDMFAVEMARNEYLSSFMNPSRIEEE